MMRPITTKHKMKTFVTTAGQKNITASMHTTELAHIITSGTKYPHQDK
jgi:hypothetical protein